MGTLRIDVVAVPGLLDIHYSDDRRPAAGAGLYVSVTSGERWYAALIVDRRCVALEHTHAGPSWETVDPTEF